MSNDQYRNDRLMRAFAHYQRTRSGCGHFTPELDHLDSRLRSAGIDPLTVREVDEFCDAAEKFVVLDNTLALAMSDGIVAREGFSKSKARKTALRRAKGDQAQAERAEVYARQREQWSAENKAVFAAFREFERAESAASRIVSPLMKVGDEVLSPSDDDWTIEKVNAVTVKVRSSNGYVYTHKACWVYECNRAKYGEVDGYVAPVDTETDENRKRRLELQQLFGQVSYRDSRR